jgi:hypothetical protein
VLLDHGLRGGIVDGEPDQGDGREGQAGKNNRYGTDRPQEAGGSI